MMITKKTINVATVIGVPARYIHSHVGLMHRRDYAHARSLLPELVTRLDERRVEELVRFD